MNEIDPYELERQLDRLVDGELPAEEYRLLLDRLEDIPDGWRCCALRFLEDQALRRELGSLPTEAPPAATIQKDTEKERRPAKTWFHHVALAAALLISLSLGAVAGRWLFSTGEGPAIVPPRDVATTGNATGGSPSVSDPPTPSAETPIHGQAEPISNVPGSVALRIPCKGEVQEIELPLYEADELDRYLAQEAAPVFSPEELETLQQSGHEVRQQRRWIPVDLDDGRRAVWPVERVEIVPVAGTRYQ